MKKLSLLILIIISFKFSYSQELISKNRGDLRLLFYNVENLFDTKNDSIKNDDDFTPSGIRNWTYSKYKAKLTKIAKVICAVGEWQFPEIVGLAEIENKKVVADLVYNSPLKRARYRYIHKESPDKRGIDVALLYNSKRLKLLENKFINVGSSKLNLITRDILYVKFKSLGDENIYLFVNHWPSRYGGKEKSKSKRKHVAKILKNKLDSIFLINQNSNIIVMGDFNDYFHNESISKILDVKLLNDSIKYSTMYNLSYSKNTDNFYGSYKHNGSWGFLDQIFVSGGLLNKKNYLYVKDKQAKVFIKDFLLEKDKKYTGFKPYRTFKGFKYNRGFSDHLPIYIDLWRNPKK